MALSFTLYQLILQVGSDQHICSKTIFLIIFKQKDSV